MFGSNLTRLTKHVNRIREQKLLLENLKGLKIFSHSHKKESTGIRKFVKEFVPAIKYHNQNMGVINVNEHNTSPELELEWTDGTTEKISCAELDREKILEKVLIADAKFGGKQKVMFFGKEVTI